MAQKLQNRLKTGGLGDKTENSLNAVPEALKSQIWKESGSEKIIKAQIRDFLKFNGIFCWPEETTGIPDGRGGYRPNAMPGKSDLIGLMPDGKFLAIEVKTKKGIVSSHQYNFLQKINQNKGIGITARSIDDVINNLRARGYEI